MAANQLEQSPVAIEPAVTRPLGGLREMLLDGWELDRSGPEPAYVQIERRLVELIRAGMPGVGERVPSERDLAAWVGVSRPTARAALSSLARAGLLERGAGRQGTIVARTAIVRELGSFAGFSELARRQGIKLHTTVLACSRRVADGTVADELCIDPGQSVWYISRLRSIDSKVAAVEETYLSEALFPGICDHDLTRSLYHLLDESYGGAPVSATERLHPVVARGAVCDLLQVEPGRALMLVERTGYDRGGVPIEFARDLHRADRTRFVVDVQLPSI